MLEDRVNCDDDGDDDDGDDDGDDDDVLEDRVNSGRAPPSG